MTQTTEVFCDMCKASLTRTSNCEDYRVIIGSQAIPSSGGVVTSMAIDDPFPSTKHFCDTACLAEWVATYLPAERERYRRKTIESGR